MTQNKGEGLDHNQLVRALVDELRKQGFEILCAQCEGFEPCPELEHLTPDVKAYNRRREFIVFGLAKTCDELDNDQTGEQFKLFSHRFMPDGKSKGAAVPLCIAVTKGCETKLDAYLVRLKLNRRKNIFLYSF